MDGQRSSTPTPNVEVSTSSYPVIPKSTSSLESSFQTTSRISTTSSDENQRSSSVSIPFTTDGQRSSNPTPNIEVSSSTYPVIPKSTSSLESSFETTSGKSSTSSNENHWSSSAASSFPSDGERRSTLTPYVETSSLANSVPSKSTSNAESIAQITPKKDTTSPKESQGLSTASSLFPTDGERSSTAFPNIERSSVTNFVPSKFTSNVESLFHTTPKQVPTSSKENPQTSSETSSSPTDGQRNSKTTPNGEALSSTKSEPSKSTSNLESSSQKARNKSTSSSKDPKPTRSPDSKR